MDAQQLCPGTRRVPVALNDDRGRIERKEFPFDAARWIDGDPLTRARPQGEICGKAADIVEAALAECRSQAIGLRRWILQSAAGKPAAEKAEMGRHRSNVLLVAGGG